MKFVMVGVWQSCRVGSEQLVVLFFFKGGGTPDLHTVYIVGRVMCIKETGVSRGSRNNLQLCIAARNHICTAASFVKSGLAYIIQNKTKQYIYIYIQPSAALSISPRRRSLLRVTHGTTRLSRLPPKL